MCWTQGYVPSEETLEKLRKARLGKKHSQETKNKIAESNRRRTLSAKTRNKIGQHQRGRKQSLESRLKKSLALRGERNHNWKGGTRNSVNKRCHSFSWRQIRQDILNRDAHHCILCPTSSNLSVHHLLPVLNGGTDDPSNLVTLCRSHHKSLEWTFWKTGVFPTLNNLTKRSISHGK